jgi:pyruvyl transferase EpsI
MIKKLVGFRIKYRIKLFLQQFKKLHYFKNTYVDKTKNQAYIFLAADYGNLGDVAITYAQTKFLENNLGEVFEIIEIPISQSLEGTHFVKKHIKKGDLVTTVGGGNLGDMYDQIEYIRQLVVRYFPNNKIISFPQTFDFANTKIGQKALKIAKRTYNAHKYLVFVAREETSFKLMNKHFNNAKVILTPDIVLTLNKSLPEQKREGIIITLREDKEKNLTEVQHQYILNEVKTNFEKVSFQDTHIKKDKLSIKERMTALDEIWEKYRGAEIVVTDRLHGMIFCYITNTPCIVFLNNNHKVLETHNWIKNNTDIKLHSYFSENKIMKDLKLSLNTSPYTTLIEKFEPLIKELC